jgi:protein-L-isoaspartate(D-aspartate) O-methyltransferase
MPLAMIYQIECEAMIRDDLIARDIHDARVLDAMRAVPRECFVPTESHGLAYADRPLPIGGGQTISQPYIVALMTQLLAPATGDEVLEIGAGSGYQAAILGHLAGHVCALERDPELAARARQTLDDLGFTRIDLRVGDGFKGWPEPDRRFDRIILSCAPAHLPETVAAALKPGGRLVAPVGPPGDVQQLTVATRLDDGSLRCQEILPVRFVPMV